MTRGITDDGHIILDKGDSKRRKDCKRHGHRWRDGHDFSNGRWLPCRVCDVCGVTKSIDWWGPQRT